MTCNYKYSIRCYFPHPAILCADSFSIESLGTSVAYLVKHWPAEVVVSGSIPAGGRIYNHINGVPLHTAFHYHLPVILNAWNIVEKGIKWQVIHFIHLHDMTLILLERTWNCRSSIHQQGHHQLLIQLTLVAIVTKFRYIRINLLVNFVILWNHSVGWRQSNLITKNVLLVRGFQGFCAGISNRIRLIANTLWWKGKQMLSCQVIASALYKCIVIVAHSIAVKSQNKCTRGKDAKDTLI